MCCAALAVALVALSSVPLLAAAASADFVVAPNGDDASPGTLAQPFASVARAQEAARGLRAREPNRAEPVTVLLRGGMHYLREPLRFTPEDSGTEAAPAVYAAYPGEEPVLSGGVALKGWKVGEGGRWELTLPEVAAGKWSFTQLFVNGQRRYRPRLPEEGYYFIADAVPPEKEGAAPDRFQFRKTDLRDDWHNLDDVEVLCFHSWTMDRMRIASVDPAQRLVTFTAPTLGNNWFFDLHGGARFLVENVREALDDPGEWYLDRRTGLLTYLPMPGEDPATTPVVAPRLERLVEIKGEAAVGAWVGNLTFRGLTFAHTNWATPPEGYRYGQAEAGLPGAFSAEGARDCVLEDCRVTKVATYAVEWGRGCQSNRVERCELTDLGAGGVKIGAGWGAVESEAQTASHNIVRDCLIAVGGRLHPAGVGVWVGHSPYNVVEHNEIRDLYYSGLSVGWSWGYGASLAHHNTIQYNHIHQIGQGVLSDMGGIYTLGISPGTVERYNLIHDIEAYDYGGRGIYTDEGSSEILIQNNIVYRTQTGAFMHHYGRECRVVNNIFALARGGQIDRLREEEHTSFTFERNIVYWKPEEGTLLAENWSNDRYVMDYNCYWNGGTTPVLFPDLPFEQWQAKGHDQHSIIADPGFLDPGNGDFRLKPDSPALQLGFQPIDMSGTGRLTPSLPLPPAPRAFPPKPIPQPQPIAEDFEELSVGDHAPDARVYEENDQATIRVTDETAAGGKHSLKFIDLPGQKVNWNPHMYYEPGFASGVVEGSFDLRVEAGVQFYHEWRTYPGGQYIVGPSLWIGPDGALTSQERKLLDVPLGQWVHFDIACGLGDKATGAFDLAITIPGQAEPVRFEALPCNAAFRRLDWFGFTANGEQAAVYYLDNIHLAPRP